MPPREGADSSSIPSWRGFVSGLDLKHDCYVWLDTDDQALPEDKKARFPVSLVKLTAINLRNGTIDFNWYARAHAVDKTKGFAVGWGRYSECFAGKKDVAWEEKRWPMKSVLPVHVVIQKKSGVTRWVSAASMEALRTHCIAFGPDRTVFNASKLGKKRSRS